MHATTAQASPTITVSSPPAGQPLYDLRPTITVAYTSDDPVAPVNLATLRVTVNGFDWTGKFTAGPDSATYAVTVDDELIAGVLTIAASISDMAGASASAAANYDVFPTFSALAPSTAEAGDTISLMASGLDPVAGRNKALLTPNGLTAALSDVDRSIGTGRFTLPAGTTSGDVGLEVNGKVARERIRLSVPSVVPNCGGVRSLFATADGGWLVTYGADFFKPVDPQCPPAQIVDYLRWRFVKVTPAGELLPLPVPAGTGLGFDVRIIPDKRRSDAAILRRNLSLPVVVRYKDVDTFLPGWVFAADFDRDGNLFVVFYNGGFRIYRVSKEALAQGGDATLGEPIAQLPVQFGSLEPYGFVVSCDGFAYVAVSLQLNQYPWVQPRIFKVDLAARAVVGDRLLRVGEELHNLALSCQTNELWSARLLNVQENSSAAIARTEVIPNGFGISEDVFVTPAAGYTIGVAVGVGGSLYFETGTNAILAKRGAINACPVPTGALPVCETPKEAISILPSTTRWRPQRDTSKNITVNFKGPDDLETATLQVIPPDSFLGTYTPTTETCDPNLKNADPTASGSTYKLVWNGPWTYTDSAGDTKLLPTGNYKVVVTGTRKGSTTPIKNETPYEKVSIVEVTGIRLEAMPGAPALDANPAVAALPGEPADRARTGGGFRIFSEAVQEPTPVNPNPAVFDRVKVIITVDPEVKDAPEKDPVLVHVRSIDVDDPATNAPVVDDDSKPTDNCIQSATTPQCPTSPDGYPFDLVGDPSGANIGPATIAVKVTAIEVPVGLVVSRRQGDNYRVAASTDPQWVTDLEVIQGTGGGELLHLKGEALRDANGQFHHPQVSEMLTVWRTLHLDADQVVSTDPPFDQQILDTRGAFTTLQPSSLTDNSDPNGQFFVQHPFPNGWFGGDLSLEFHANRVTGWDGVDLSRPLQRRYDVTGNGASTVSVNSSGQVDLYDGLAASDILQLTRRAYLVRDDEITALDQGMPPTALAESLLAKAYIRLSPIARGVQPLRIKPGLPDDERNLDSTFVLPPTEPVFSTPDYWSTVLTGAFEPSRCSDADPQPNRNWTNAGDCRTPGRPPRAEGYGLGVTGPTKIGEPMIGAKLRSAVFLETLRDLKEKPVATIQPRQGLPLVPLRLSPDTLARVTAHEILHTLTLIHDDAIMCSGLNIQDTPTNVALAEHGGTITNEQLNTLRGVKQPDLGDDPNPHGGCPQR